MLRGPLGWRPKKVLNVFIAVCFVGLVLSLWGYFAGWKTYIQALISDDPSVSANPPHLGRK